MTFDFDPETWKDDGVVDRCQPDISRSNRETTWIEGAAINGHKWGFYNNEEGTFVVYYFNDAGHWDSWTFTESDDPYGARVPDPDRFEANVTFALRILCDPAVREYNATLTPALPPEPPPSDAGTAAVVIIVDPDGRLIFPDDQDDALPF